MPGSPSDRAADDYGGANYVCHVDVQRSGRLIVRGPWPGEPLHAKVDCHS
jgi:hypothetical protein